MLLRDLTNNTSLLQEYVLQSERLILTWLVLSQHKQKGKSNNSDVTPTEETKVDDDVDARGTNLEEAIKSFWDIAETVNAGFVSLKEYIVRNGRRFNEHPLGEQFDDKFLDCPNNN